MMNQDKLPLGWAPQLDDHVVLFNEDGEHVGYVREEEFYEQGYCDVEPQVVCQTVRPARAPGRPRTRQRSSRRTSKATTALDSPSDPAPCLDGMTPAERRRWLHRATLHRQIQEAHRAEAQMIEAMKPDVWVTVTATGGVQDWQVRVFLCKVQKLVCAKTARENGKDRLDSWVNWEGEGKSRHAHIHIATRGMVTLEQIVAIWKEWGIAWAERPRSVADTAAYSVKSA